MERTMKFLSLAAVAALLAMNSGAFAATGTTTTRPVMELAAQPLFHTAREAASIGTKVNLEAEKPLVRTAGRGTG
jgi:hypothetical protein